ncbi:Nucleoid-associated protein YgaU, contains BON and LysM domains [Devosia crocina]|uniref:Nucleoid-associated protein YgaU, contains BON and LysM domains n=1 Tax=Devosia crocina TaxID=429728 RepID=A0A1I7NM09_9HYPH|nr:LysM peptidoglycan-binding domain-containing protein [Devosia crocina]SFV35668.1 Nucleoid-associated protein YgaU, contains BON and LysM domains [Devosia crocina]
MEDKLAETAPKRPLALTIGAAAVTILVIAGLFAAPTVVNCFNSPDGMGQCIRGKFTEAGLFPTPPATAVAETEAPPPAEVSPAVAEPEAAPAATPEAELPSPAIGTTASEARDSFVAASFGLLRAEPDGSVVIAGSGTPGSEVEVYSDGALLGRATVERSGDWVLVPEAPLPPGGVEITLAEAGKDGEAEQSFVVVIDEDRATQPLVVASAPGQATEILQGLERPVAETTTEAASIETVAETEPVVLSSEEATSVEVALAEPAERPDLAEPQPGATADLEPSPITPVQPQPSSLAQDEADQSVATATAPSQQLAQNAETPVAPAEPVVAAEESPDETAPDAASATVEAQTAPAGAKAAAASPPPTIDAIEIEGERTFFAGAGPEDGVVRLYVDDQFIADAIIDGGRWLVEAGAVLDAAAQRVRADLLAPGSSEVAARAEVDFVLDMPEVTSDVAEAPLPNIDPQPEQQVARSGAPVGDPAPSEPASSPPVPATPQESVPAALAPDDAPEETSTTSAPPATEPASAEPAVPRMVAVSVGGPDAQRFAAGKAIIRRGDNLWTIARRTYGEGIRYTTIYQANSGRISDPNRIYPGQVFDLPN